MSQVKLRGDRNQCPTCHEYFNSVMAFDKHRIGNWTTRRCLKADEMTTKGMLKNRLGFWVTKRNAHRAYL